MSAADRVDVAMLIARIAQLADAGTPQEYLSCFTDDAVWELADAGDLPMDPQRVVGHEAILAGVHERRSAGIQGPGSHTRHDVSSIVVEVSGDHATARSYFRYYTDTLAAPVLAGMGTYTDAFRRDGDGWKLSQRVITRS